MSRVSLLLLILATFLLLNGASARVVNLNTTGEFDTIQAAVDNASDGHHLIVNEGDYTENVLLNKTLTLTANGTVTVNANDTNKPVFNVTAHNTQIRGFTIINGSHGICLDSSNNSIISNNTITSKDTGILLEYSDNCTISNNTVVNNDKVGIHLHESGTNIIINNMVTGNNWDGIGLGGIGGRSSNNIIINNLVTSNGVGVNLATNVRGNIINNNIITNNRVFGMVLGEYAPNTSITNNNISNNNGSGIYLYGSDSCTISNNTITNNNGSGIYLYGSDSCTISNNTITNNEHGIRLLYGPKNSSITSNTITNNTGHGIWLEDASNNTLSNNTVVSNSWDGIILLESYNNTIRNNIISSNRHGIALGSILGGGSGNNTIRNNIISRSTVAGIGLWSSPGNWFAGNYFINNTQQIIGGSVGVNLWNTTEGGNYWSDYTGDDLNGDGTGDSPYSLISGPLDYKPLIVDLMIDDITTASNIIRVRVKNNGKADMTRIDPGARFPVKIRYGTQEFIQYINPLPAKGTKSITQSATLNLGGVMVTVLYNETTHYLGNTSIRDANIRNNRASCIGIADLVNASSTVKSYYERYGRLPANVRIMGQNYSMAQLLYLLCRATVNINAGNLTGIMPRAVGYPTSPGGSYRSGNIYKSEYVSVARNIIDFIKRTGRAPNYVWTSRGRIPFQRLTYMYTKIIRFYGKYHGLPKYVYI